MRIYLVDNGSLQPASYLNLRRIARELSTRASQEILPVSLLHSSKIQPEHLDGEEALVWERQLKRDLQAGHRKFAILPFFFGPTGAITDYIPRRLKELRERFGPFQVAHFPFIAGSPQAIEPDLIEILADQILQTAPHQSNESIKTILVDHGSPLEEIAKIRNAVAEELSKKLPQPLTPVYPTSMERRPGDEYAFNDPLLEYQLTQPEFQNQTILLSYLFLSPGRHAGPQGDIAQICQQAQSQSPNLKILHTPLVGQSPKIIDLLLNRLHRPQSPI